MPLSGRPEISFYHQQAVKSLDDVVGDGWMIEFDAGAQIVNENSDIEKPDNQLVGLSLLTSILSNQEVLLKFGVSRIDPDTKLPNPDYIVDVVLDPMNYRIVDGNYEGGPFYPGRPDIEEELPDLSARTAEGPEEQLRELEQDEAERVGLEASQTRRGASLEPGAGEGSPKDATGPEAVTDDQE